MKMRSLVPLILPLALACSGSTTSDDATGDGGSKGSNVNRPDDSETNQGSGGSNAAASIGGQGGEFTLVGGNGGAGGASVEPLPGICEAATEQWQGCNSCSVCSEKITATHKLYFVNNSECEATDDCGGDYFSCSAACPEPTQDDVCSGSPGGWDACRGDGCSVCVEELTGHKLYLENHPNCVPNETCGSVRGACNDLCPEPSNDDICGGSPDGWEGCRGDGCSVCTENLSSHKLYFLNHPTCVPNDSCGGSFFACNDRCPAPTNADVCYGTPGTWAGCRGDGCSVCSELLTDYPKYFENHPTCVQNDTCDGVHGTCNALCPEPTDADK